MATIAEKMVESLEVLRQLQKGSERVVLNGTKQMSRTHLTPVAEGRIFAGGNERIVYFIQTRDGR